jgi:hypothetical protein
MTQYPRHVASLPITRDLTLACVLSLVAALLMTAASVVGLLYQNVIYPTDDLLLAFVPNDIINLAVGLPILLIALALARRGKLIGLLCWPGALFYVVYSYLVYVLAVPFGALFLPHLLLVSLSAYTIIGIVANIDADAVRQRLAASVPARVAGGILLGLAILIIVREIALVVAALTTQRPLDPLADFAVWVNDFLVACPALLVGGLTLWRRQALGYVIGAGLFLQYAVLSIGLIAVLVFQAIRAASPVDLVSVVVLLAMAALCLTPFAFFVRGASSKAQGVLKEQQ